MIEIKKGEKNIVVKSDIKNNPIMIILLKWMMQYSCIAYLPI